MINKVFPDKERAKSMFKMAIEREQAIKLMPKNYPTIIAENYYEVIKELANSLLLTNGFKAIGDNAHKEILEYLKNFKEFNDYELSLLQDLRIKRNKSQYEGEPFENSYLENKKENLSNIIKKLKNILIKTLK